MTNYSEMKNELLKQKKEIEEEYAIFFNKVMKFGNLCADIANTIQTENDLLDYAKLANSELDKINRLMVAMMYVEQPQNKEIIKLLMENIAIMNSPQNNNFKK